MTPSSNNSQTRVTNVVKIYFQAIGEVNFRISLKNLVVCIEKLKLGVDLQVDGLLRKNVKHQTEVDNNP